MKSFSLLLNNKAFSYEQIKKNAYEPLSPFEERTLDFCSQWLNGQKVFEQKTSGSTGTPKKIKITRSQMLFSAKQTVEALSLQANDVALVCLDVAQIAGKMMLVRAFEYQLQIVIIEPSSNPLEDIGIPFHFVAMVPMQFENAMATKNSLEKIKDCKAILLGGAPVGNALAAKISKLNKPVFATFGMTETVSHIALKRLSFPNEEHYTIIGDTVISANSDGQLIIKGSITNNEELITNDRVEILSTTTFKWLGRIDNVVNSGGIKIQLEEVENSIDLLFNELNIKNHFFLAAKPDTNLGEKMVLFVESTTEIMTNAILEKLKNRLNKHYCPRDIIYVPKFSTTSSGKLDKPTTISNCF